MIGLVGKFRSFLKAIASQGVGPGARLAISKVCDISDFVALQRDLLEPAPPFVCTVKFELRRVDDFILQGFRDMPDPFSRHYKYRFEYGQRHCFGAFVENQIRALMWPVFRADNRLVLSRWRYLLDDEARLSSIWVDPTLRGTGLMAACMEKFAAFLKEQGFRYMYAFTWKCNYASLRFLQKTGFHIVGRTVRVALPGQKAGHGLYYRSRIHRDPVRPGAPKGGVSLPDLIP